MKAFNQANAFLKMLRASDNCHHSAYLSTPSGFHLSNLHPFLIHPLLETAQNARSNHHQNHNFAE